MFGLGSGETKCPKGGCQGGRHTLGEQHGQEDNRALVWDLAMSERCHEHPNTPLLSNMQSELKDLSIFWNRWPSLHGICLHVCCLFVIPSFSPAAAWSTWVVQDLETLPVCTSAKYPADCSWQIPAGSTANDNEVNQGVRYVQKEYREGPRYRKPMSYARQLVCGILLTHAWVCSIRALNPILESRGQPALMLVGKKEA